MKGENTMSTELLTTLFMLAVCILATVGAVAIIKIIRSHPKKELPNNVRFMSLPEHLQTHERVHRFYGAAGTYFDVVIRGEFPTYVTIIAVKIPLDCYKYASPIFGAFKALSLYNDAIFRPLVKPTIDDCRSYDEKLTALENRQEILDKSYDALFDRISDLEERRPLLPDDIVKKILSAASERAAEKLLENVIHKNSVTQLDSLSERVKRLETKHIPSSDYIGKKISDGLVAGLEKPSEKVEEAISKIAEKILANSKGLIVPDNDAENYTGCCDCAGYDTCPTCKRNPERLPEYPESRESELRRFVQNDLYSILHDTSENVVGCFYNSNGNGGGVITIALMNAPSATLDIHEATVTKLEIINRAVVVIDDTDF